MISQKKIYANNDFDISKLTAFSNMFRNRKKLRGGNGSYLANPSTADKTWLRVDRPGVQGYFTRKPQGVNKLFTLRFQDPYNKYWRNLANKKVDSILESMKWLDECENS